MRNTKRKITDADLRSVEVAKHIEYLKSKEKKLRQSRRGLIKKAWQADVDAEKKRKAWEHQKIKDLHIYIIVCGNYFKVGIATCPYKRLSSLQTGNPQKCWLYAIWKPYGAPVLEKIIHAKLKKYHVRGEWFRFDGIKMAKHEINTIVRKPPILETEMEHE